jgi:hypothetical protein
VTAKKQKPEASREPRRRGGRRGEWPRGMSTVKEELQQLVDPDVELTSDGRKLKEAEHVGARSPDTDGEPHES